MSEFYPISQPCPSCTILGRALSTCSKCGSFIPITLGLTPPHTAPRTPAYAAGTDIGEVRLRLLSQAMTFQDAERELEISQLGAQIEFLGVCAHSRRLCERIAHLVAQRPPAYVAALEQALGLAGAPRD